MQKEWDTSSVLLKCSDGWQVLVVEVKKPILEFAEKRKLVTWAWWGTVINTRLSYISTFSSSEGLFWWRIKKVSLLYVPTKTGGIQWVSLKWEFTWSHIVINGKAPPLTERSGKDELNLSCPTPSISVVIPVLHKESQGMVWVGFFPSSERKSWEVEKLYLSHALPLTVKGASGQFISRLVSEEPHLQCWANDTCRCNEFCKCKVIFSFPRAWKMQRNVKLIWFIQLYIWMVIRYF